MTYVGNGPEDQTVLRLQARKSFALSLYIVDRNRSPLDISGCTITMVVRKNVPSSVVDDSGNLLTNSTAVIVQAVLGWCRFELQASDLDFTAGEYIYTITLRYAGFSSVIVQGPLELEQNTEFTSVGEAYVLSNATSTALSVVLYEDKVLEVQTGPTLAPGQALFTKEDERHLDELYAYAVTAGQTLNADMIPDGITKVIMTLAERDKLANLTLNWGDIVGKPDFGDIITHDDAEYVRKLSGDAGDIVSGVFTNPRIPKVLELRGISDGTGAPPSGNPYTLYLKHS